MNPPGPSRQKQGVMCPPRMAEVCRLSHPEGSGSANPSSRGARPVQTRKEGHWGRKRSDFPLLVPPGPAGAPHWLSLPSHPRKPEGHKPFGGICDQPAGGKQQGSGDEGGRARLQGKHTPLSTNSCQTLLPESVSLPIPATSHRPSHSGIPAIDSQTPKETHPGSFLTPPALQLTAAGSIFRQTVFDIHERVQLNSHRSGDRDTGRYDCHSQKRCGI